MTGDWWEVLTCPVDALPRVLGTEAQPSTIPAPDGGWGVPGISDDGLTASFGCPRHHITAALRAAWPSVKSTDGKTAAVVQSYKTWTTATKTSTTTTDPK